MVSLRSTIAAAALAASAIASSLDHSGMVMLRADDVLNKAYSVVSSSAYLERRQDAGAINDTSSIPRNSDGSINMDAWNTVTDAACIANLKVLVRSTNPTGHCVCYNLPSLNAETGIFEAELRLYRVSEPRDEFTGVRAEAMEVKINYAGAQVSKIDTIQATGMVGSMASMTKRALGDPQLARIQMLKGQINPSQLQTNMNMAQFEVLLLPTLTLEATNTTGQNTTANVSLNEATFLTGVFSNEVVVSDFGAAQASVTNDRDLLKNSEIAFVLPGVQIMIFPIGLVITGTWLLLGVIAYGWGTVERMNYAAMYHRQKGVRPRKTI